MVVDAHCHAGKGDGLVGPWDTDAPLGAYARRARAAGITHTVLFPAFSSDYRRANAALAGIVARGRGRYLGFAGVHPVADRGRVATLIAEAVTTHRFRGIKAHRHDGRLTREVCEAARRWRLPIVYDVMGEVSSVELFAGEYPDVRFVIPHLGSFADEWRAQRAFLDVLARLPNVYTDTSGVRRFDLLVEAVHRAGSRKLLFGSDGPWLHPGLELAKVVALDLPPVAQQLVLAGNLRRLLAGVRVPRPSVPPRERPTLPPQSVLFAPIAVGPLPTAADPWTPPGGDP